MAALFVSHSLPTDNVLFTVNAMSVSPYYYLRKAKSKTNNCLFPPSEHVSIPELNIHMRTVLIVYRS